MVTAEGLNTELLLNLRIAEDLIFEILPLLVKLVDHFFVSCSLVSEHMIFELIVFLQSSCTI